jgi:hypothetical protein
MKVLIFVLFLMILSCSSKKRVNHNDPNAIKAQSIPQNHKLIMGEFKIKNMALPENYKTSRSIYESNCTVQLENIKTKSELKLMLNDQGQFVTSILPGSYNFSQLICFSPVSNLKINYEFHRKKLTFKTDPNAKITYLGKTWIEFYSNENTSGTYHANSGEVGAIMGSLIKRPNFKVKLLKINQEQNSDDKLIEKFKQKNKVNWNSQFVKFSQGRYMAKDYQEFLNLNPNG